MLVLSRKQGEAISIGTDVVISVIEILNGRVRLGIEAPVSVPVHRVEVREAIQQGNSRNCCPNCLKRLTECQCETGPGV
jgi:carbon storage regulator